MLLAKSLPQKLRHKLGPLQEFADTFLAAMEARDAPRPEAYPLAEAISLHARRESNLLLPSEAFRLDSLPAHLSMNFRVVDEHGRQLATGRNLAQLRATLGGQALEQIAEVARSDPRYTGMTAWDFGELEEVMDVCIGSETLIGFPALVDHGESVSLEVLDSADKARVAHRKGLRRLFMLQLKEQTRFIERKLPGLQALTLQFMSFGDGPELKADLLAAAFDRTCMHDPLPRTREAFEEQREEARARVGLIAQEIARLAAAILAEYQVLQKRLQQSSKAFPDTCRGIQESVSRLLPKRFIEQTPFERLQHFPRYLKAASLRLDKLRADPSRDARLSAELHPLEREWLREASKRHGRSDPKLEQFRWLLEELRVQLYAQELKTPVPVSVKRLAKMWQTVGR